MMCMDCCNTSNRLSGAACFVVGNVKRQRAEVPGPLGSHVLCYDLP